LIASLAVSTAGRDMLAMVCAVLIASGSKSAAGRRATPTRPLGFLGAHEAAGETKLHRLGLANGAGQTLRAAGAGNDAKLDLGLTELRIVRRQNEIAHHRQLTAAAKREAAHRRDDRLANTRHRVPARQKIAQKRVGEVLFAHFFNVGAGGEAFSEPVSTTQPISSSASNA